jgi:Fe-S cluster biogenesis protein NfuA
MQSCTHTHMRTHFRPAPAHAHGCKYACAHTHTITRAHTQGACSSCPSSTVTLKMGIERALREQFGDRLGLVRQVSFEPATLFLSRACSLARTLSRTLYFALSRSPALALSLARARALSLSLALSLLFSLPFPPSLLLPLSISLSLPVLLPTSRSPHSSLLTVSLQSP